jgi:hypothetical protein
VANLAWVRQKRPLTSKGAKKLGERERAAGLDPKDEATRWLDEHDPPPKPQPPKAASKSKVLHQWRQRQQRGH